MVRYNSNKKWLDIIHVIKKMARYNSNRFPSGQWFATSRQELKALYSWMIFILRLLAARSRAAGMLFLSPAFRFYTRGSILPPWFHSPTAVPRSRVGDAASALDDGAWVLATLLAGWHAGVAGCRSAGAWFARLQYSVDYYSQSQGDLLINGDYKNVQYDCKDLETITNSSK